MFLILVTYAVCFVRCLWCH